MQLTLNTQFCSPALTGNNTVHNSTNRQQQQQQLVITTKIYVVCLSWPIVWHRVLYLVSIVSNAFLYPLKMCIDVYDSFFSLYVQGMS